MMNEGVRITIENPPRGEDRKKVRVKIEGRPDRSQYWREVEDREVDRNVIQIVAALIRGME